MEIAESPYGSDNVGLVCGYLFKSNHPGHAIESGAAAVLALPLTIVPGMFGMNVAGIPFSQHASGSWVIVLTVTGAVTAAGALARSRYRGRLF